MTITLACNLLAVTQQLESLAVINKNHASELYFSIHLRINVYCWSTTTLTTTAFIWFLSTSTAAMQTSSTITATSSPRPHFNYCLCPPLQPRSQSPPLPPTPQSPPPPPLPPPPIPTHFKAISFSLPPSSPGYEL